MSILFIKTVRDNMNFRKKRSLVVFMHFQIWVDFRQGALLSAGKMPVKFWKTGKSLICLCWNVMGSTAYSSIHIDFSKYFYVSFQKVMKINIDTLAPEMIPFKKNARVPMINSFCVWELFSFATRWRQITVTVKRLLYLCTVEIKGNTNRYYEFELCFQLSRNLTSLTHSTLIKNLYVCCQLLCII